MRHRKVGRKLGRNSSHRKAMFSNMVVSLFKHEGIETTEAKAKELRKVAERLITVAKHGNAYSRQADTVADENDKQKLKAAALHKRRLAAVVVRQPEILGKLFTSIEERFRDRPGGYTRMYKLGFRKGDGAAISRIELVGSELPAVEEKPES